MWATLNFEDRSKMKNGIEDICKGTLDIEFERDWSFGWNHFSENENLNIFLMWTTLNFEARSKTKKKEKKKEEEETS